MYTIVIGVDSELQLFRLPNRGSVEQKVLELRDEGVQYMQVFPCEPLDMEYRVTVCFKEE